MKRSDFFYELPPDLIARFPAPRREESRLLVVHRREGTLAHYRFSDLPDLLHPEEFLGINQTRVAPARLLGQVDGRRAEALMVGRPDQGLVTALCQPARHFRVGARFSLDGGPVGEVVALGERGRRVMRFDCPGDELYRAGYAPLPPYLKRKGEEARRFRADDLTRYQTVFAAEQGHSVAAPTAGLHFSDEMLAGLEARQGVERITLEVGTATFQPIDVDDLSEHRMGVERVWMEPDVLASIEKRKGEGRHLLAVGTTSVRSLESQALLAEHACPFETALFIQPGFTFRKVDHLLTNLHLPESSLLVLVAAFMGMELMREAYRVAVAERYRFFSYGDAMLIL